MRAELKALQRKLGISFIHVTHSQDEAMALADLILVMNDGIVEQYGTPMEIFNKPSNAFVANFIGGHNVLAIGSKLFAVREDRINLTQNGNSQVNAIEFLGPNVKIKLTHGKSGNLTVSQSDVLFAKSKIEVGDHVKASWSKKDQLELVEQENNKP